tara:strand:- start:602 stop:964 length:363 start_codon:yes stop_codon:yes gene_type:complete
MNNSQIDRDKPEGSIPDLIAEARERQAECAGLSEKEVSRTPISMILLNSTVAKLVNALESVTAPTENEREVLVEWRNEMHEVLESPEHLVPLEMVIDRIDAILARFRPPVPVEPSTEVSS